MQKKRRSACGDSGGALQAARVRSLTMTPTHRGIDFGWVTGSALRRTFWAALALVAASAASVTLVVAAGPTAACLSLARATAGPDVSVTALPGVDLQPVLRFPGLSASAGPYPGIGSSLQNGRTEVSTWIEGRPARGSAVDRPLLVSGSWPRRGGVVVEQGLARRLGLRTGGQTRVATTRGSLRMRVTGIAETSSVARASGTPGLAYVLLPELRKVAPAPVHGSTVLLRTDGRDPGALARLLE